MYKVKRFSSNSELEALVNRVARENVCHHSIASKTIKVPTNQGLFGSSSSSKAPSRSVLNSSVRSLWRLHSYIKSVSKKELVDLINTYEVGVASNKAVKASDYVSFVDKRVEGEPWNITIINPNTNPLAVMVYHESWLGLVDPMFSYMNYDIDYYSDPFKTDDGYVFVYTAFTIDNLKAFISMLTYFGYIKKVYGNDARKVYIHIE